MPTLYSHPLSTYAQRVHIALHEKGVHWDIKMLDFQAREHRGPEYLKINPYGRVPGLLDGTLRLAESTAILDYLEAKHPTPALMPTDPAQRAEARMHIKLCDLQFAGHVGTIIFPKRFLPEERWKRELMAEASKRIHHHLIILDAELAGRSWLLGDTFTMADVAYAPFLQFLPILDVEVPPNVQAYAQRLGERPSVAATRPADAPAAS